MRKNKTWNIALFNSGSVIDLRKTEQIENDEFWTSDTEAYLNFIVLTPDFEIESAQINLYNKDDSTLVHRDITKDNNELKFKMPKEIIEHWGRWSAQVIFKSGGNNFTSPLIYFEVKRTLGDNEPEQLGIIQDWIVFETEAKELINLINDNELARQEAEAQRQSTFENNETTRQETFTQTEVTRTQAELDRQAQEEARETAEGERETAEVQRKADHANRSAEFDGKADKVVFKNLVPVNDSIRGNGSDFSILNSDTGELKITLNSLSPTRGVYQSTGENDINDIVYVYAEFLTKGLGFISLGPLGNEARFDNKGIGEYHKYSTVNIMDSTPKTIVFYHNVIYEDSYEIGDTFNINKRMAINLTQAFGAGNEPTKEEMDKLIEITGYIDEEYALNNKEMLEYLMKSDKVVLKNLIENGDFSEGLEGWHGISDDELMGNKAVINHSGGSRRFIFHRNPRTIGNITYSRLRLKVISNPDASRIQYLVNGVLKDFYLPESGEEIVLSGRELSVTDGNSIIQLTFITGGPTNVEISEFVSINLTATFGAGNEPTKEEMDELIKFTGYINDEYALNNKDILNIIMQKVNKKQEEWQTLPLINGWTSESSYWGNGVRFFKDTLNIVHIEGRLDGISSTDSTVGFLPMGYRPSRRIGTAFTNGASRVEIASTGRVVASPMGGEGVFNTSFRAE